MSWRFATASDAVAAALDVQTAFACETWPTERGVKVRIALHSGEVRQRDEDNYFGPVIIRCDRLRSVGHGGQILLSNETRGWRSTVCQLRCRCET